MNRNRKLISLIFSLLLIFTLAGCSGGESQGSETTTPIDTKAVIPDRQFDVQGQVKSIIGNEVVVNLMVGELVELTEEEKAQKQAEMQNLSPEEKQALNADKRTVSDETKTFIIPVGVPIVTIQNGGENAEEEMIITTFDLADIKKGTQLKIWFREDSAEGEAEFVQIQNSSVSE